MANRVGMPTFLDVFPVSEKATNLSPERALFVDIGAGYGQQAIAFKQRYPQLEGRVIIQDLAPSLEHAMEHPGVEKMAYDFFSPQIVQGMESDTLGVPTTKQLTFKMTGAKFYYLRNILHDWTDRKCQEILQNILDAMAPASYILIDDMVLLNEGVHWQQAQLDMLMMASLGARERTKEQWYSLVEGTGLIVNKVHVYTASLQDSIIELVPGAAGK